MHIIYCSLEEATAVGRLNVRCSNFYLKRIRFCFLIIFWGLGSLCVLCLIQCSCHLMFSSSTIRRLEQYIWVFNIHFQQHRGSGVTLLSHTHSITVLSLFYNVHYPCTQTAFRVLKIRILSSRYIIPVMCICVCVCV